MTSAQRTEFAVNYSPEAEQLLEEGRIEFDRFKCPPWPDLIATARVHKPVYIHYALNTGDGSIPGADWVEVERLRRETNTPFVNVHLHAKAEHFPDLPVSSANSGALALVAERLTKDVEILVGHVGAENVIVENVIYEGPEGAFPYAAIAPEVINHVIRTTGCGLLLDTAHARLTSAYTGFDVREYISKLPVDRLREWHITGVQYHEPSGKLRDHMPMCEADWDLVEWGVEQIRSGSWATPRMISCEYGGVGEKFRWRSDLKVVAEQFPRLHHLISMQG